MRARGARLQVAQHRQLVARRRRRRLQIGADPQRPARRCRHRGDVDAGVDARQGELLAHRVGRHDAEVGDHRRRSLARQPQARAGVAAVEVPGRGDEVEPLDEGAPMLPQRDQHFLARGGDLRRADAKPLNVLIHYLIDLL